MNVTLHGADAVETDTPRHWFTSLFHSIKLFESRCLKLKVSPQEDTSIVAAGRKLKPSGQAKCKTYQHPPTP